MSSEENLTPTPHAKDTDKDSGYLDQTLRPGKWGEYIGQKSIKDNLHVLLTAAKERNHPPEHI